MARKIMIKTVFATLVGVGAALATLDPDTRMEKVRELFTQYGPDTFKVLNGQDIGGAGTGEGGKGHQVGERGDISLVTSSADGFVFCVSEGKWAVYPPDLSKIGADAMTIKDADGKPFIPTMIEALRKSEGTGKAKVKYTALTPDGQKEHRVATIWNKWKLHPENKQGKRFFCGVSTRDLSR